MKKMLISSAAVSLLLTLMISQSFAYEWFTVKWVDDGDTIVLENKERIRYIGMNTPEIAHPGKSAERYGYEAAQFNKKLVLSEKVRLEFDSEKQDQYGRTLAYVFLEDGTMVNEKLVEQGYAYVLTGKSKGKYDSLLLKKQQAAMDAGKGMWKDWKNKEDGYIGNSRSKRFHTQDCHLGQQTGKKNRVAFSSTWTAFYEGFAPCKKCMPAERH
jgi:micrococcal nuclease